MTVWVYQSTVGLNFPLFADRGKRLSAQFRGDGWSACQIPQSLIDLLQIISYPNSARCWVGTDLCSRASKPTPLNART